MCVLVCMISYIEDYIWCVLGAVEGHCGLEAAQWQAALLAETMAPSMMSINCKVDYGKCKLLHCVSITCDEDHGQLMFPLYKVPYLIRTLENMNYFITVGITRQVNY